MLTRRRPRELCRWGRTRSAVRAGCRPPTASIGDGAQGAAVAVAALAQRDMRGSRPQGGSGRDVLARSIPPTGAECDGRPGAPWRCRGATSSPADRHEVVCANALHDEELARAIGLAVHVMRGLRRYRAALAGQEPIDVA